ncbi:MAG: hypothetical protein ACI8Z0_001170 [Lentimonas sp.]|jgi:hypothetical protein
MVFAVYSNAIPARPVGSFAFFNFLVQSTGRDQ